MISNDVVMEVAFILLMALSVGLGIAFLTLLLLWIFPPNKKRMKPLNEAVDRQRKEEKERREKELKRKLL